MRTIYRTLAALSVAMTVGAAQATLVNRGGGMIYDSARNITWLQDWNLAKTSAYDDDGHMRWNEAMAWASQLVFGGYDDWRLPTMQLENGNDCYNGGCPTGEISRLWSVELGNIYSFQPDYIPNTGEFLNIYPGTFWTSTRFFYGAGGWWVYQTSPGQANAIVNEGWTALAVAVRDGDVTAVPEPATFVLVGAGLAGIGLSRRRNRAR